MAFHTGYIGKWHLESHDNNTGYPSHHGFNEVHAVETSPIGNGDYWFPYSRNSTFLNQTTNSGFLTDRMFLVTRNFVERNAHRDFFVQLSLYSVHTNLEAPQALINKYNNKRQQLGLPIVSYANRNNTRDRNPYLAAMVEKIDAGVGSIVNQLNQLGIADDTVIVFYSDNGGEAGRDGSGGVTNNGPLREGKRHLYEGGIREPLIVKWPGVVQPGRVSSIPVSSVDLYPTFVEMTGSTMSSEYQVDGVSIVPLLRNGAGLNRENMVWSRPLSAPHKGARSSSAIRKGDFKLIEFHDNDTYELYNIVNDRSEMTNLANTNVAKRNELAADLHKVLYGEASTTFTEDFNNNDDLGWTKFSGIWRFDNGVYKLLSEYDKQKSVASNTNFSDFTYEADVKIDTAGGGAGLIFRTTLPIDGPNAQRGYYVGLNAGEGVRLNRLSFNYANCFCTQIYC